MSQSDARLAYLQSYAFIEFLERRRNKQPSGDWQYKPENNVHTLRNRLDYVARVEDAVAEAQNPNPQEPLAEDLSHGSEVAA